MTAEPTPERATEKRLSRSKQERRRIVEATMGTGVSIARVARANGVNANQGQAGQVGKKGPLRNLRAPFRWVDGERPRMLAVMSAANQLTDRQRASILTGHYAFRRREMVRHWMLTERDLALVNERRRQHNRLGFAVQGVRQVLEPKRTLRNRSGSTSGVVVKEVVSLVKSGRAPQRPHLAFEDRISHGEVVPPEDVEVSTPQG